MNDLISRQAAIEAIWSHLRIILKKVNFKDSDYDRPVKDTYKMAHQHIAEVIERLPSAEPERKKGKWIKMSDADGIYYCCSECGEELYRRWSFDRDYDLFPKKETIERTNFCPNCGAKMAEGES